MQFCLINIKDQRCSSVQSKFSCLVGHPFFSVNTPFNFTWNKFLLLLIRPRKSYYTFKYYTFIDTTIVFKGTVRETSSDPQKFKDCNARFKTVPLPLIEVIWSSIIELDINNFIFWKLIFFNFAFDLEVACTFLL